MIWFYLVQNPPFWVKSFLPRQVKFLATAEYSPPDASQPRQTTLAKFPSLPTLGIRAVSQPRWLTHSTAVSEEQSGSWRPGEKELPANTPGPKPEILQRGNTEEEIFPPPPYILSPGGATAPPAQPLTQPDPLLLVPVREGLATAVGEITLILAQKSFEQRGPQIRIGINQIVTGPSPLVTSIIGKPYVHLSWKILVN